MGMWSEDTKGLVGFLPGFGKLPLMVTLNQTSEQHLTQCMDC